MQGAGRGIVLAFVLAGCGSDDPPPDLPKCGTLENPDRLELTNVQPAPGSSVPNQNIVHRFTIVGSVGVEQLALSFSSAHTAGDPTSPIVWSRVTGSLDYEAPALSWSNAPAKVELESTANYQTPDGCVYAFETPVFSYDVTAP